MIDRLRLPITAAAIALVAFAAAGCNSSNDIASADTATGTASFATVPEFSAIQKAVTLDDADAAVVQKALADWKQAAATSDRPFGARRAGMDFVAAVAPSLDNDQLSDLVDFLVDYRTQKMQAMHRNVAGRHGNGKGKGMNGKGMNRGDRMLASLDLTADQQKVVDALHKDMRDQMRAIHTSVRDGSMTRDQAHDAMTALHESGREKLKAILTEDQMAKLDAAREKRMNDRLDRRISHMEDRSDTHVTWLSTVLGLDASQTSQVRDAAEAVTAKRKAELEAVKEGTLSRDEMRNQARETREAMTRAVENVLTQEQSERLAIIRRLQPQAPRDF